MRSLPGRSTNGVDDLAEIMPGFLDPDASPGGPPAGQDRLYQRPALIGQVG